MLANYLPVLAIMLLAVTANGQEHLDANDKKHRAKNYDISDRHRKANLLLESAADEIRDIDNFEARITLAEEVVKLLARQRPDRCRHMLDAIFDKLLLAKSASPPDTETRLNSNLRRVISIAATFDYKLAQSYVDRVSVDAQRDNIHTLTLSGPGLEFQLMLATQLIEKDPEVAVTMAARTLQTAVTGGTLVFLGQLRNKAPVLAGSFFSSAINSVKARQGRDVNELFLLYSYAFSLTQVPRIVSEQLVLHQLREYMTASKDRPVDAELARLFLRAAAEILLEPSRYTPANVAALSAGPSGDLYLIKLVLPYVKTYLPPIADRLAGQQQIIAAYLNPDRAAQLDATVGKFNAMQNSGPVRTDSNYESSDHFANLAAAATETVRKDQLFYRAATAAVKEKRYETAMDLASNISLDARDQARQLITFSIAERTVADGDLERAQQLARRDDDVVRRAYILTLVAKSFFDEKGHDMVRANELLIEIRQLADKVDKREEGLSILLGVAGVYALFDQLRAFETLREIVNEANKLEKWAGDYRVRRIIVIGGFGFAYELYNNNVSLPQLVSQLAGKNFDETLITVQGLKNGIPRLRSIISLCGMALSEK